MPDPTPLSLWLEQAPRPVCIPVAQAFDEATPLSLRHDALWFSVYQLLRCTGLCLLSETLQQPDPASLNPKVFRSVTRVLTCVRHPFFSDWITLLWTLLGHRKALGHAFLTDDQAAGIEALKKVKVTPAGYEDQIRDQPVLDAFRLLRNLIAHGGMRSEAVCSRDLDVFLPHLRGLLEGAFSFLAGWELLAIQGSYDDEINRIWHLNGPLGQIEDMDLSLPENHALARAFEETPMLFRSREAGRILSIYPWFLYREEPDFPKGILDGFFLRGSRPVLYYLDQDRRQVLDPSLAGLPVLYWRQAHERLGELLDQWKLSWDYDKKTMTPWKLRDPIAYHTALLIEGLMGTKYVPAVYCERKGVDDALARFCFSSPLSPDYPWRAVLLGGELGRGKSALLAHLAHAFPERPDWQTPGEEPPLLLFIRCDGAGLKADIHGEDILFRNAAPSLGIKADPLGGKGYSGFAEFLTHLDQEFSSLERPCRFILFVDGVNEAPYPEPLLVDLVRCIQHGRNFPWLRVVFSVRTSYLLTLRGKRAAHGGHESNPLYDIRDLLLPCPWKDRPTEEWELPALTMEEARNIFENYRKTGPACLDAFDNLSRHWEKEEGLLRNPLYIRFWMEAFHNRRSASVSGMEELFECWLQEKFRKNDGLWDQMRPILAWLLDRGRTAFDEEGALAFRSLVEQGRTVEERRTLLNPLEAALSEGLMVRPLRGEGTIQFPFEALAAVCFARYLEERLQKEGETNTVLNLLDDPDRPIDPTLYLAVSLYLESLFKRKDFNRMARFLDRSAIRENAMFPWVLREMGDPEGLDVWEERFLLLMEVCPERVKRWAAGWIDGDWTKTIRERFVASLKQPALNLWAADWRREQASSEDPQTLRDLSISLNNCGNVLRALGGEKNLKEALRFYEECRKIFEELKNPAVHQSLRDLSISFDNCGNVLKALGGEKNLKEALRFYEQALKIREELKNPAIPQSLRDLSEVLFHLGQAKEALIEDEKEEALEVYESALKMREELRPVMGTAESWTNVWESAWGVARLCEQERAERLRRRIEEEMEAYEKEWGPLPPKFMDMREEVRAAGIAN